MNSIEKIITLPDAVEAPIAAGDKIGEVEFVLEGQRIGGTDIVAKAAVPRVSAVGMFGKLTRQLFFGRQ